MELAESNAIAYDVRLAAGAVEWSALQQTMVFLMMDVFDSMSLLRAPYSPISFEMKLGC